MAISTLTRPLGVDALKRGSYRGGWRPLFACSPPQLTFSEIKRVDQCRYCFTSAIFVVGKLAAIWNIKKILGEAQVMSPIWNDSHARGFCRSFRHVEHEISTPNKGEMHPNICFQVVLLVIREHSMIYSGVRYMILISCSYLWLDDRT